MFISESRDASEQEAKRARRTTRRLGALLVGVAVLLLAAIAGGIFAAIQRTEARKTLDFDVGQSCAKSVRNEA